MAPVESSPTGDGAGSSTGALLRAVARAPSVPLAALAPPLVRGDVVEEFEVQEILGAGGMGVVYRARDRLLDRDVALKLVHPSWDGAALATDALLEREARATARLRHPNVVTIHRVGRHAGRLFLVLELLEGETLASRLERGPLGETEAIALMLVITDALAHAHAQGVLHRDLKPGNVFLEKAGGIKVLDFGLAGASLMSHTARADDESGTSTLLGAGTPGYMAPEQWRGETADARTDVYAAGVLLDELVTGRRPQRHDPRGEGARATPRRRGRVTPEIDDVINQATAPDRGARFADPSTFAAALRAARAAPGRRRRRSLVSLSLTTAVLAAVALWWPRGAWTPTDLSGTWHGEPAGWGTATLTREADGRYAWQHQSPGTQQDGAYLNRGVLRLEQRAGTWVLAGRLADVPGWCCDNVGYMEIEVVNDHELEVVQSRWGRTHETYGPSHTTYSFHKQH